MGDFAAGRQQAPRDHVRLVLAALVQALFERIDRRRQDENAGRARKLFAYLARALPVDFQQDIGAGRHLLLDHDARGAIVIAVHFGPFQEFALVGARDKVFRAGEIVFTAVLFPRARRARGGRDRQLDGRFLRQQRVDQGRFAGARWRGDHEQAAGEGGRVTHAYFSIFCGGRPRCCRQRQRPKAYFTKAALSGHQFKLRLLSS